MSFRSGRSGGSGRSGRSGGSGRPGGLGRPGGSGASHATGGFARSLGLTIYTAERETMSPPHDDRGTMGACFRHDAGRLSAAAVRAVRRVLMLALVAQTVASPRAAVAAPQSTAAPRAAAAVRAAAAAEYPVTGMIVSVNPASRTFVASIQAIPNYMAAMTMPFEVRQLADLERLAAGVVVTFTLVVDADVSYATRLSVVKYANTEQDPFSASRLKLMRDLASAKQKTRVEQVAVGAAVPDFTLIDQQRRRVSLSSLRGKIVVANFIYTTCALPNFCLRLANNFGVLQRRFAAQLGKDLVLLTVTFDPIHDTPEVMATYAKQWSAHADTWRFLTGPPADVDRACALFGVHAFATEGLLDHSLHTVIIGRDGTLLSNIEGNQFTATQLGDVVAGVLATRNK